MKIHDKEGRVFPSWLRYKMDLVANQLASLHVHSHGPLRDRAYAILIEVERMKKDFDTGDLR